MEFYSAAEKLKPISVCALKISYISVSRADVRLFADKLLRHLQKATDILLSIAESIGYAGGFAWKLIDCWTNMPNELR